MGSMRTVDNERVQKLSGATGIEIQDAEGKMLDYVRLPSCTRVTISFVVAGRRDALKPVIFDTGKACDPPSAKET